MNKILLSLLTISAVLVVVAAGTGALFSNTASNNGDTFGSGTLILTINGESGTASSPVFTVVGAAPGYSEDQVLALQNTGSIGASNLLLTSVNVIDTVPGGTNLGDVLTTYIWEDTNGNGVVDGGENLWVDATHLKSIGTNINLGALGASVTRNFKVKLVFDSGAGNTYQGEGVSFNFNFQANQ